MLIYHFLCSESREPSQSCNLFCLRLLPAPLHEMTILRVRHSGIWRHHPCGSRSCISGVSHLTSANDLDPCSSMKYPHLGMIERGTWYWDAFQHAKSRPSWPLCYLCTSGISATNRRQSYLALRCLRKDLPDTDALSVAQSNESLSLSPFTLDALGLAHFPEIHQDSHHEILVLELWNLKRIRDQVSNTVSPSTPERLLRRTHYTRGVVAEAALWLSSSER